MKKLNRIFLVASLALLVSCQDGAAKKITNANPVNTTQASQPAVKTDSPVMSFDKTTHDFGTIKEGEKVTQGAEAFLLLWKKMPKYKFLYNFFKLPVIYSLFSFVYEIIAFFLYIKNKKQLKN